MGFCIGGKWCRTQECRSRCESWFGTMPDVKDACRKACDGSVSFSKEEFLCSGQYLDVGPVMLRYKYDPCNDDSITMESILDPANKRTEEEDRLKLYAPYLIGASVLFLGALALILFAPTKKE